MIRAADLDGRRSQSSRPRLGVKLDRFRGRASSNECYFTCRFQVWACLSALPPLRADRAASSHAIGETARKSVRYRSEPSHWRTSFSDDPNVFIVFQERSACIETANAI
jgi:hypothetical protein